jgi:long-chain acyl-CoA synthetase
VATYADRPWTQHYDAYVPPRLNYPPNKVLSDFLRESAKKHPDKPALITTVKLPLIGRQAAQITYRQLDEYTDAFAAGLVAMGLKKGDCVALVMPNCTAFAIAYWGILKAGGIVAATNPTRRNVWRIKSMIAVRKSSSACRCFTSSSNKSNPTPKPKR